MKKLVRLATALILGILVVTAIVIVAWLCMLAFFNGYEIEVVVFALIALVAIMTYVFYEEIK